MLSRLASVNVKNHGYMFILRSLPNLPLIIIMGLALVRSGAALAFELPAPATLLNEYSLKSQNISVIEPHESKENHAVMVRYQAFSMTDLLTKWFSDSWKLPGAEIVFFAKDGYRSVVNGDKFNKYHAFLAFARADGLPFIIDNTSQNQYKVPLGPYYLIWANQDNQELQRQGAYNWPYQVNTIELHGSSENSLLLPQKRTQYLEQGLSDIKTYCLTCHHIRGVGGKKYPVDLLQATCQWANSDLKALIRSPGRFIPNSTMPSLGPLLPPMESRLIIERVVNYLNVMQTEQHLSCGKKTIPDSSIKSISKGLLHSFGTYSRFNRNKG